MPRKPRKKSNSGIYHIVMRGINRQNIFEDDEDKQKFLAVLQHYKEISEYELFAYCLMGNHVHLLLRVGKEPLEQIMRRICGKYVYWYNKKYERIGNLFQDRFKSEPVEDDTYFLAVLRYIHNNPCKAGLVKDMGAYKWSSYSSYITSDKKKNTQLVDVGFALELFDAVQEKAVKSFSAYHEQPNDDTCLDIQNNFPITDREAREIIKRLCEINYAPNLQKLDKQQRDYYLRQLKEKYHLSIRQIERLTGINRGIISRA